jgi:hypothetical protein
MHTYIRPRKRDSGRPDARTPGRPNASHRCSYGPRCGYYIPCGDDAVHGASQISQHFLPLGASMMGRPPRHPVDLQAVTRDIRNRAARAAGNIDVIAQNSEPIFSDPRQIMLDLVLANHEIEAAISIMRKAWWP